MTYEFRVVVWDSSKTTPEHLREKLAIEGGKGFSVAAVVPYGDYPVVILQKPVGDQ